jgi:NAD(P)-dependent dehydrogenase (short-subunit alcohol dehydrogenase family)
LLSMKDKVAIVTGAGSVGPGWGNGKATATLLARQGASVFLVDINQAAVEETRQIIDGEGGTCAVHRCDMLVAAEVQEMVQACLNRFKRIDILVNNVGGSAPGDPVTMTEEVWDHQIDMNLKTVFLGCKYVLPVMDAQRRPWRSRACRLQRVEGGGDPVYSFDGGCLCQEGHSLQHGRAGSDAHAFGGVSVGEDGCR